MRNFVYKMSLILKKAGIDFNSGKNPAVLNMQRTINRLEGGIKFKIEFYPDGSWAAESENIDGIITGGKIAKHIDSVIKDAIFTYFEVPPHLCNDNLLKAPNEPVVVDQRVWAAR
ncbi:MAG: Uncharacterized protein LiPW39_57 [Parcubacteria group bacterium LiPW_39]|nr:MAG: Uncharacterized protein LiPW39_57 [Parcubacteria group bacterium LiPW_39]